ncbi:MULTISPECIES: energy-coupling factor transporter transmembrane component T [unclassified Granulicatella]|uniref:energy-coupling factor transporter transmembrane component T n=1 Tax=unclassified Granulicatella TaxID=2630493 RepID=UPI001073154E|nr:MULTISPECIES: energy-coupling factor transporter transmembrane component T [unclassified Granulicatella]MBF0779867.1 energy-coupling factor transporter transmembrane protein EcfT [Granulicatella sp. 19428wC4_WM01]TFU96071.1 energy-coupling factor transporter transmembrane protein EcfT [Granulicatella sp. WM01]
MILDVRMKFCLIFIANYLLLKRVEGIMECVFIVCLASLFILAKKMKKAVIYTVMFILLYSLHDVILDQTQGSIYSFLSMLTVGGRMMLPCIMAGDYLFHTSRISQLINALRMWRVPEPIVLTFAVMFRFFPVIRQDIRTIQQSLKVRGIFMSRKDMLCSPLKYGEYVLIPLVMSSSRTAQDLTIATMTKSIAGKAKSMYHQPKYTWFDGAVFLSMCAYILIIEWRS